MLIIVFGFFFVTVASRIVGLIGTSSNPVSGMTIATLMATCLIFVGLGWTGDVYQPMALCVGGMVCIAAANAGATSQDLKTGYLVGATPRAPADRPADRLGGRGRGHRHHHADPGHAHRGHARPGACMHAIGSDKFPAPQGTLMATLIKGLLSFNLDWQFVLVGVFIAITIELCGVKSLSFAVGPVPAAVHHRAHLRGRRHQGHQRLGGAAARASATWTPSWARATCSPPAWWRAAPWPACWWPCCR